MHAKTPRPLRVCAVQGTGRSLIWLACLSIALNHINFANKCGPLDSSSNENEEDRDSDQKSLSRVRMALLYFVLFCLEWFQEQEKGNFQAHKIHDNPHHVTAKRMKIKVSSPLICYHCFSHHIDLNVIFLLTPELMTFKHYSFM